MKTETILILVIMSSIILAHEQTLSNQVLSSEVKRLRFKEHSKTKEDCSVMAIDFGSSSGKWKIFKDNNTKFDSGACEGTSAVTSRNSKGVVPFTEANDKKHNKEIEDCLLKAVKAKCPSKVVSDKITMEVWSGATAGMRYDGKSSPSFDYATANTVLEGIMNSLFASGKVKRTGVLSGQEEAALELNANVSIYDDLKTNASILFSMGGKSSQ